MSYKQIQVGSGSVCRGVVFGIVDSGSSTGTVEFGVIFATVPVVVATIHSTSTIQVFSITVNPSTTAFSYAKNFVYNNLSNGAPAPSEKFYWVAYGT